MTRETEYDAHEQRVAKYIVNLTGVGAGEDPIGFLITSHDALRRRPSELLIRAVLGTKLDTVIAEALETDGDATGVAIAVRRYVVENLIKFPQEV